MEFRIVISKITLYLIEHFKSITVLFRNGVILVYQQSLTVIVTNTYYWWMMTKILYTLLTCI